MEVAVFSLVCSHSLPQPSLRVPLSLASPRPHTLGLQIPAEHWVLPSPLAEALCPGLYPTLGSQPYMPADANQVSQVSKEGYCEKPAVGAAEDWTAFCPSQQGSCYCSE